MVIVIKIETARHLVYSHRHHHGSRPAFATLCGYFVIYRRCFMGHDDLFRVQVSIYREANKIHRDGESCVLLRDRIQSALPGAVDQQYQAYGYRGADTWRGVLLGRFAKLYRGSSNRRGG